MYSILFGKKINDDYVYAYRAIDEQLNVVMEIIASSPEEAIEKFESSGIKLSEFSKERIIRYWRLAKAAKEWFNKGREA